MTDEAGAESNPADWPDGPCPCQLAQTHCARCHRDLATILDDKQVGLELTSEYGRGRTRELWACAPTCKTAVTRPGMRRPGPGATPPARGAQ